MAVEIKLSQYRGNGAKIFTDRDNGVRARRELKLDELDQAECVVNVIVPTDTWGINPSFFGGLFEESIRKFNTKFREKYVFMYSKGRAISESLNKDIDYDIEYVIRNMEWSSE